jgi:hypothetical protein
MRRLGFDLARKKCHINDGARECKFLTVDRDGYVCGFLDIVVSVKLAALDRAAKSGPCQDPYDDTTEAQPPGSAAPQGGGSRP